MSNRSKLILINYGVVCVWILGFVKDLFRLIYTFSFNALGGVTISMDDLTGVVAYGFLAVLYISVLTRMLRTRGM